MSISSKAFQKKKKAKYDAQAKAQKLRAGKGKGKGRHFKGIRYAGVSGKGKGKQIRPQLNVTKQNVAPPITKVFGKDSQWIVSMAGVLMIQNYLLIA